jgi:translation initiation factor IF-2
MAEEKQKKVKVFQIAKELNISHDTILEFLRQKGYDVKSHMSSVTDEMINAIYVRFRKDKDLAAIHKKKVKEYKEKYGKGEPEKEEKKKKEEVAKKEEIVKPIEEPVVPKEEEVVKKIEEPAEKHIEEVITPQEPQVLEKVTEVEVTPVFVDNKIETGTIKEVIEEQQIKTSTTEVSKVEENKITEVVSETPVVEKQEEIKVQIPKQEVPSEKPLQKEEKKEQKPIPHKPEKFRDRETFKKGDHFKREEKKKETKKQEPVDKKKYTEDKFGKTRPAQPVMPPTIIDKESAEKTRKRKRKKRKDEGKFDSSIESEEIVKKKKKKIKEREIDTQEINEAIKRTFAEMEDTPIRTRSSIRKKKKKERLEEQQRELEQQERERSIIRVTEFTSVNELANIMNVKVTDVMQKCFSLGMMVSINQRLDSDTIQLVADEFGYQVEFQKELITDSLVDIEDDPSQLVPRAPVVTIMGHVDHGKTSLLDYIRNANVVAGEAGGITQHIGAYKVVLDNGKEITFIDTPGHEAFTSMRARGAKITDIVVLVVAADDNVMPQTVEAISHAQAANVPIIVAINKIDKPNANPDRIRQQLSEKNILVEEWGGKYQSVEISAKFGKNVDLLLEKILLEAEILDLKANPNRNARGVIIEAELDKGKGIVATALIQKGTLKIGDPFIAGIYSGKVRAMFDERGNRVETAKPSTPIQLLGFDGIPQAGDEFIVLNSEKEAKEISSQRQLLKREQDFRQVHLVTLDDISQHIKEGGTQELNIIVKGDVDGSVEALSDSLMKLSNNEVKVKVIHRSVGAISESDVLLAAASQAIIIGFNVRPNMNARKLAEKEAIEIRLYNIIYNAINDVKSALEGMLAPEVSEEIVATVEVREVFKVPKVGTVAGCYVQEGKITRNTKVRLIRDGIVIVNQCNIASLKRFKDDVREVDAGFECGIGLENYNDIKVGDIIEGYRIVEKKRKLQLDKV